MSPRRFYEVFRAELMMQIRRPLLWVLIVILGFLAWGMSTGHLHIRSGDSDIGGKRAFITSQFQQAQSLSILILSLYGFFVAVAAGMIVIRDDELKVGELLHSTSLTVREYVWGKYCAVLVAFLGVLVLHTLFLSAFNHLFVSAKSAEFIGPFSYWNYLKPALIFGLPVIVFISGVSQWLGELSRKPIMVFALPTALLLVCIFFLWSWSPGWLDPRVNQALGLIDPSGSRWLAETWTKVDRGVAFYNTQPVTMDLPFLWSRIAFLALGFAGVALSARHFARTLRGKAHGTVRGQTAIPQFAAAESSEREVDFTHSLRELSMQMRPPGLVRGVLEVCKVELVELKSQPGLYLFVPLILLQTIGMALVDVGPFDTPLLQTSGLLATREMNTLTLLVCLLLLFYTVESLERERARDLAPIYYATPVKSAAILFGKTLANSFVGLIVLFAAFVASAIVLAIQGKMGLELRPFVLVWGLLLVPTFLVWCAFTTALYALVANRYTTYALALVALIATAWFQTRGTMNWVGNWNLWNSVRWSDMGTFELIRRALVCNRVLYLALAIAFTAFAVKLFPRRALDGASLAQRLHPTALLKSLFRSLPWLAVPIAVGSVLWVDVQNGFQGDAMKKKMKDYWAKNVQTYKDAPKPAIVDVTVDLVLEPDRRWFQVNGTYSLVNDHAAPLRTLLVTPGAHFDRQQWTIDLAKSDPVDRAGLKVFALDPPLAPDARLQLGFAYEGFFPAGATKNGGGTMEFILPSGVVLTSFSPSFMPQIGYDDTIGLDEDNKQDAKEYADDFYVGITESGFGNNIPHTTHVTIHAPAEYTLNSVGTKQSDVVENGERTVVWESDHPVNFFNVVCGKWAEKHGEGTTIYYHPGHEVNVDEMLGCLDGARKWYSEWFAPYPWKELKLSEFPGLASYAQGFATNITFSESIGFLTESDPKSAAAFMVTAHESAHQWWGNMLEPGKGPGGQLLSEGMAHFSTILLTGQMRGEHERIELCHRFEDRYGDNRQVDSERPVVKCDGSRPGDTTVTYDKGGWVFWMLMQLMGREEMLHGLQAFIVKYEKGPDHPVLQDFTEHMREYAPDKTAYDAFVKQWFFQVAVPEYKLSDVTRTSVAAGDPAGSASSAWDVHLRLENSGGGTMPIEVAAARGERFPEDAKDKPRASDGDANVVAAASAKAGETKSKGATYHEARTSVVLGPKESLDVTIHCDFEPERVLVDPDAHVLQLRRKLAIHRF